MRLTFAIAALCLALSGGGAQAADAWRVYRNPEMGFSIELPGEPAVNNVSIPSPVGPVPQMQAAIEHGTGAFIVAVIDMRGQPATVTYNLENGATGAAAAVKGVITKRTDFRIGDTPGLEIEVAVADPPAVARARIIYANRFAYSFIALGPKADGLPADTDRVMGSFAFIATR